MPMVPMQVDGVGLGYLGRFKSAGHLGHELAEYADAAVPESRLRKPSGESPRARGRVERFHHVGQLEGVVITAGHV